MVEKKLADIEEGIMEICVLLHSELYKMREDPEDSMMELEEVLQLESVEAITHIGEAIKDLL